MHITLIAGARPNFIKISPIINAIKKKQSEGADIQYSLVHTGQHYDKLMSGLFFEELNIPEPDVNLAAGSGTQAEQTASIMVTFEKYLMEHPTDLVLVVGDVTSTMACSIVAKKMGIQLAHVEAGIRSFDMSMPEEINRIVTDSLADYFFITSDFAKENLKKNGINVSLLSDYYYSTYSGRDCTLVINYSALKKERIAETVERMSMAIIGVSKAVQQ